MGEDEIEVAHQIQWPADEAYASITAEGVTFGALPDGVAYFHITGEQLRTIQGMQHDLASRLEPFNQQAVAQMLQTFSYNWTTPGFYQVTQILMDPAGHYVIWLHFPGSDKTYRISNLAQYIAVRDKEDRNLYAAR